MTSKRPSPIPTSPEDALRVQREELAAMDSAAGALGDASRRLRKTIGGEVVLDFDAEESPTAVEARKSSKSLQAPERCPAKCASDMPCDICEGKRYTDSGVTLSAWKIRFALRDTDPPTK